LLAWRYPAAAVEQFPDKPFYRVLRAYGLVGDACGVTDSERCDHSHPYQEHHDTDQEKCPKQPLIPVSTCLGLAGAVASDRGSCRHEDVTSWSCRP